MDQVARHFRWWLNSPILDRHVLLHFVQVKLLKLFWLKLVKTSLFSGWFCEAFLLCLFSSSCLILSSSACLHPSLTAVLHSFLSSAVLSHCSVLMPVAFRSRLQASLKRRYGRPVVLVPAASWPYKRSFGSLSGPIRRTCPSQRRRRCVSRPWMDGTPTLLSTS